MIVKCPRCGIESHIVNYQCDICGNKIYPDKPAYTRKKTYIVPISIFAAIILIGFIAINTSIKDTFFHYIIKNFMRDTSSPSAAYVGHWRGNGVDIYVEPNGTMISKNAKGDMQFRGIWKVTSEDINKRKIGISWTNAEDSKSEVNYDLTFSEDYKSYIESYVRSGSVWKSQYIYIDNKTTPVESPLSAVFSTGKESNKPP